MKGITEIIHPAGLVAYKRKRQLTTVGHTLFSLFRLIVLLAIGFVVLLVSFMLFVSFYDVKKLATPLIRSMEKDGEQKTENVEQESQNVNVKAEPVKAN